MKARLAPHGAAEGQRCVLCIVKSSADFTLQFAIGYRLQLARSVNQDQHHCTYRDLSRDACTSTVLTSWTMVT